MVKIVHVCDGIYRNDGDAGPKDVLFENQKLIRFMDKFYLRCDPEHLTAVEVSVLCAERAKDPSVVLGPNGDVRTIFKKYISLLQPKRFLEIGAGNNPIFSGVEAQELGVAYSTCDADPKYADLFSGQSSELSYSDGFFDMASAVFVLHFRFYEAQVSELFRCLANSGIFVANVYWRSQESRKGLAKMFLDAGFSLSIVPDEQRICRDHEYWILGKRDSDVAEAGIKFREVLVS
ncbi:hypothetical protein [Acidovorax sp. NCPPB 4044]|uniref:hypothetical protein n=1 Tax=Acidovorax sp. NCPPB 4044 TaxID=2940490 RepID=UPI002302E65C|nr:hypothetical protein [Acidovorax sp. NCPPB 4044]MDA8520202.1 hypothetical protein [Acidovorax sp. NCPPB 4044]